MNGLDLDNGQKKDLSKRKPILVFLSLPEYTIDTKPDYSIGQQVDKVIKENFDVKGIIIRALSSSDHPQYSFDELIEVILEKGTDKYDPNRRGVAHEEFEPYQADFQGGAFEIDDKTGSMFGGAMRNFYENAPIDRGYPLRIDLLLIYDKNQLIQAEKVDKDKPGVSPHLEPYLFRFKDSNHKQEALLGIVKILK